MIKANNWHFMILVFSVPFVNWIRDPVFTSPQKNWNELFTKSLRFADIQFPTNGYMYTLWIYCRLGIHNKSHNILHWQCRSRAYTCRCYGFNNNNNNNNNSNNKQTNKLKENKTRVAHGKHWQCWHADLNDLKITSGWLVPRENAFLLVQERDQRSGKMADVSYDGSGLFNKIIYY